MKSLKRLISLSMALISCVCFFSCDTANRNTESSNTQSNTMDTKRDEEKSINSHRKDLISIETVESLPDHITHDDVCSHLNISFTSPNLIYDFPASEGGYYRFSFFPPRDLPDPISPYDDFPFLSSVVKFSTYSDMANHRSGTYVYPKKLKGKSFTRYLTYEEYIQEGAWLEG